MNSDGNWCLHEDLGMDLCACAHKIKLRIDTYKLMPKSCLPANPHAIPHGIVLRILVQSNDQGLENLPELAKVLELFLQRSFDVQSPEHKLLRSIPNILQNPVSSLTKRITVPSNSPGRRTLCAVRTSLRP